MWKIKNVKKEGKKHFKKNVWTLVLVGIFMSIIVGEYAINNDGFSNLQILEDAYRDKKNNAKVELVEENPEVIINKYVDQAVSQLIAGNKLGIIKEYNSKRNVTKGVFFTAFNILTNTQSQLQKVVSSISDYSEKVRIEKAIVMIVATVGLFIKVFITNPLLIGEARIYLESINYHKTKVKRIIYPFKKERYVNSFETIFLMKFFKLLWNLTIVGGLIKNYSYKMIPYIEAENPNIKPMDAIKMSKEMMNGNKFQTFKLDLTFIGWWILEYVTFGLAGMYVTPYLRCTYTELYIILREEYIKNKKYNFEMLNDELLYDKELALKEYPDLVKDGEIEKYPDENKRHKIKIDYNKKYELTSILLFFFIFSFAGWLWEVGLYIFKYGTFINRGMMYGPWLPIYGTGCTLIILLTKFKCFRKMLKNPTMTFIVIFILCTIIEYLTSYFTERIFGRRYWDYTGVFLNINGRVCFECSLFFGIGGSMCVYIIAPLLERMIQRITNRVKIVVCTVLVTLFCMDQVASTIHPRTGIGITQQIERNNV